MKAAASSEMVRPVPPMSERASEHSEGNFPNLRMDFVLKWLVSRPQHHSKIEENSRLIVVLSSYVTPGPYFERTVRTSSKSLNGRKIARMAPILTIFGPNRSRRRDLFFEKFSNERRRHRRLVVVSSSPSSSPSSPPSSPQHNYSRSQLPRTTINPFKRNETNDQLTNWSNDEGTKDELMKDEWTSEGAVSDCFF